LDGGAEFLIGALRLLQFEIGLSQLMMRIGIAGIDLDRVDELDRSLTILSLFEILLSAVKILLLADVGIAGTRRKERRDKSERYYQPEREAHDEIFQFGHIILHYTGHRSGGKKLVKVAAPRPRR